MTLKIPCCDCGGPTDSGYCVSCLDESPSTSARKEIPGRVYLTDRMCVDIIPRESGGWLVMFAVDGEYVETLKEIEG